jgi:hypothetical protein
MLTTQDVIEDILAASRISAKEKPQMESRLVLLCKLAREEQSREFRRVASRLPEHGVLQ